MNCSKPLCRTQLLLTTLLLAVVASSASAQQIYRSIGPDGRPVFSDKPPSSTDKAAPAGRGANSAGSPSGQGLPFELRQVVSRFPVTLYTGEACAPCASGRSLLSGRGVPFAERTVATAADLDALQKLSGNGSLPFLTIGGQKISGYQSAEWNQYLDAAGYPASSALPAGYRNPSATPLSPLAAKPIPVAAPEPAPEVQAPAAAPPGPSPSNPAGIRF